MVSALRTIGLTAIGGLAAGLLPSVTFATGLSPVVAELPPLARAKVLMGILGIVVLGFSLFVLIRLVSWFARRRLRERRRPSRMGPQNWAAKRFLRKPTQTIKRQDDL